MLITQAPAAGVAQIIDGHEVKTSHPTKRNLRLLAFEVTKFIAEQQATLRHRGGGDGHVAIGGIDGGL